MTILKPKIDFLIFDFETLSHRPQDAMVVSLGAICGTWGDSIADLRDRAFYRNIECKGQEQYGLKPSETTIQWWKRQPAEVSKVLTATDKQPIEKVLEGFSEWCVQSGVDSRTPTWIRAPHFDFTIMSNLYEKVIGSEKLPFSHWMVRDCRTAIEIMYGTSGGYAPNHREVFHREGITQHCALEDCIKEFLQIRPYFLKGTK